jgi:hypothetical protein
MQEFTVFPDKPIHGDGRISKVFMELGITGFHGACRWVHELPYGYNSDRDDLMILFKEKMGSCTTKHAVIATLAAELNLAIHKHIGIYAMTEERVTGTQNILDRYHLPYVPMVHCFLVYETLFVDLSEGNRNGKNGPIDDFLWSAKAAANISAKDEYMRYRKALEEHVLPRQEMGGLDLKTILKAREAGLSLLRSKVV